MKLKHLTPTDELNLTPVEKEILHKLNKIHDALMELKEQ